MTFTHQDVARITEILAEAARDEVMPRFKALADGDVRMKSSEFDPVSAADEEPHRLIRRCWTAWAMHRLRSWSTRSTARATSSPDCRCSG
jgi:hypothetical protein